MKVQDVFIYFRIKRKLENYHESEMGARWIFSLLTFRTGIGIKQLEKDHNRTRDPFFTHPPKLQACKDNFPLRSDMTINNSFRLFLIFKN